MIFKKIKRERRREKRHYCNWPIWFASDDNDKFFYGDIVEFSSDALSLISGNKVELLEPGQRIKVYFGYSQIDMNKSGGVDIFSCLGRIYRLDILSNRFFSRKNRIAIRLDEALPFSPPEVKALNVIFEILQNPEAERTTAISAENPENNIS